jgi:hypothetical protein
MEQLLPPVLRAVTLGDFAQQILAAERRDFHRIFCAAIVSFDGYPPTLLTKDIIDGVQSVIHLAGGLAKSNRKIRRIHWKLIQNTLVGTSRAGAPNGFLSSERL